MNEFNSDQSMKTPCSFEFTSPFETFTPPSEFPSIVDKKKSHSINDSTSIKESQNTDLEKIKEELSSPMAFMNHRPSLENSKRIRHKRVGSDINSSLNDRSINIPRESWNSKKNDSGVYGTRFKFLRGDKLNTSDSPKRNNLEKVLMKKNELKGKKTFGNENLFFNSIIKELKSQTKLNYTRILQKKIIEQVKDMELLNSPTINYIKPRIQSPQIGLTTLSPPMKHSGETSLLNMKPLNDNFKPKYQIASVPYTRQTTPKQPLRPRLQSEAKSIVFNDPPEKGKFSASPVIYCETPKNDVTSLRARRHSKTKVSKSFHSIEETSLSVKQRDRSLSKDEVNRKQGSIQVNIRKATTAQSQCDLDLSREEKKPRYPLKSISSLNEDRSKQILNIMNTNRLNPLISPDVKSNLLRKVSPSRAEKKLELKKIEELMNHKKEEMRIKKIEQEKKYMSLLQTHIGPSFERVSEKLKSYQELRDKNNRSVEKFRKH